HRGDDGLLGVLVLALGVEIPSLAFLGTIAALGNFTAATTGFVLAFRTVGLLDIAAAVRGIVHRGCRALRSRIVARLEVVQDLGLYFSDGHYDAVNSHQHHGGQKLLSAGRKLGARGLNQRVLVLFIAQIQTLDRRGQTVVDALQSPVLVHAIFQLHPRLAASRAE